jgi:YidC/Oxa1 family membrane protein insertase
MSKPAPKQNFLQTFLIVSVLYLGFMLLTQHPQQDPAAEKKTSADVLKTMLEDNAQIKDATLSSTDRPLFSSKVDLEKSAKRISPAEAERLELYGDILLADTQLKASILRTARSEASDANLLQQAYFGFRNVEKKFRDKPIWKQRFTVTDVSHNKIFNEARPGWNSWTGEELYSEITTRLDKRYRSDLLLGFVPGYQVIDFLVHLTGANPAFSYAFAAFLLALLVRAIIYPLAQKQLMWSRQMSQLQPLVKEIKKQYSKEVKDPRTGRKTEQVTDPQALQMKTMELYKEYGINPFAGCGPALIQMPLFLVVYQCMLHYQFTFQKGTFLWMNPSASAATHGFFASNLGQQDYLMIGIYGVTMVISTLLTPVTDPSQAKQQRMLGVGMGLLFTVMMFTGLFPVPGAFVLYWTFTNLLAMTQSLRAYRMPVPPLQKVNAPGGGVFPTSGTRKMGFMERLQEEMRQKYEASQSQKEPPSPEPPSSNGKPNMNGSATNGKPSSGQPKKEEPKHKPKKRPDKPAGPAPEPDEKLDS